MIFTARTNKRLLHATKTATAAAAVVTICIPMTLIGVTGYSNLQLPVVDRSRFYTSSKTFLTRATSNTFKSIFKSRININDYYLVSTTYKYFALLKLPAFFTSSRCYCESISQHEHEKSDVENSASVTNTKRSSKIIEAALYYEKNGILPPPAIMHAIFDEMIQIPKKDIGTRKNNITILIIGDIHGCYDELQLLVNKATIEYNNGINFDYIISVGDMVNKGPKSIEVIQQFRIKSNFYAIRGNHDNAAIQSYLKGDIKSSKYLWIDQLTDTDIEWMLELPYTIRIPYNIVNGTNNTVSSTNTNDTIIVHAGLVPNQDLVDQNFDSMVFIRDVAAVVMDVTDAGAAAPAPTTGSDIDQQQIQIDATSSNRSNSQNESKQLPRYVDYYRHVQYSDPTTTSTFDVSSPVPWASAYNGPYNVIFGHDAKRGIQLYTNNNDYNNNNNNNADDEQSNDSQDTTTTTSTTTTNTNTVQIIGLDSGCCYGNQLSGLVLPGHTIVQVNATKIHCPIIYT